MPELTWSDVRTRPGRRGAFTLVEILIVVIILGILAAIVIPQYASATTEASQVSTLDQLVKVRRQLAMYNVRENATWPTITAGDGTWGSLLSGGYMREAPKNLWVGGANQKRIVLGTTPDTAFQSAYGWIFNPATGDLWAGSFDATDTPLPRP